MILETVSSLMQGSTNPTSHQLSLKQQHAADPMHQGDVDVVGDYSSSSVVMGNISTNNSSDQLHYGYDVTKSSIIDHHLQSAAAINSNSGSDYKLANQLTAAAVAAASHYSIAASMYDLNSSSTVDESIGQSKESFAAKLWY